MDPLTAGVIVGGQMGLQLLSGYWQADIMRGSAELSADISRMNAKYSEIDAWEAEKAGYSQIARYQAVTDQVLSDQTVTFASQGVTSSSSQELQKESKLHAYLNVIDMQKQARAQAKGFKVEASNYRIGAGAAQAQGAINASNAQAAGVLGAINSGVSGYLNYKGGSGKTKNENISKSRWD